ncbi:MAG TPA: amino acid adenylation domain-containing protein [Terriglobales bacterium]
METKGDGFVLSGEEWQAIVEGFNQTREDFRRDLCFHELFEEQVERTPERNALVFQEQRLTYRALNARANQLAHYLRRQGVRPSTPVGLFVQRSADMIIALLGILKAGGAYVPLHPDLPEARLAHQLQVTKAPVLVTQESLEERLPEFEGRIVLIDRERALFEQQSPSNPDKLTTPADLIYLIFTSGSTGTPKGVATRHENVTNYTQFIVSKLGLMEPENSAGLQFANVSTLSADLGNTPIFAALSSGGCLHMIADEVLLDGQLYAEHVRKEPIDVLKIAPSHLRALMTSGDAATILPRKWLVIGGESLHWDFVRQIKQARNCAILNHYSPTETTIGCLTFEVDENNPLAKSTAVVPLGRPIANTLLYILNQELQPAPLGVAGDLYIGGAGVSNGYIGQAELTAARFMADPLNPGSGLRFYRSGDRARWLPSGIVEFLGREDDQVKIRGFRVELGEIEAVLLRHPVVKHAAVVVKNTNAGDQTLLAFVVGSGKPDSRELREYLLQYLPDYMVPSSFVPRDSLPLNANGKVDRRALAESVPEATPESASEGTLDPVQEKLVAIWSEILGVSNIRMNDNFFELGGHSLLAVRIIARVRTVFGAPVPLRSMFEAPTVAALAEVITQYQSRANEEDEVAKILGEIEGLSEDEAQRLLESEK